MKLTTKNEQETIALGKQIGSRLKPGMCITMEGDLGAGKTTLTKGIAQGLHIERIVNSPTFTIMKVYEGNIPLYHIDAYRLEGAKQDLGFEEYIEGDGVAVIEWAQFIEDVLPKERLSIHLKRLDENERLVELHPIGSAYEALLGDIQ